MDELEATGKAAVPLAVPKVAGLDPTLSQTLMAIWRLISRGQSADLMKASRATFASTLRDEATPPEAHIFKELRTSSLTSAKEVKTLDKDS